MIWGDGGSPQAPTVYQFHVMEILQLMSSIPSMPPMLPMLIPPAEGMCMAEVAADVEVDIAVLVDAMGMDMDDDMSILPRIGVEDVLVSAISSVVF